MHIFQNFSFFVDPIGNKDPQIFGELHDGSFETADVLAQMNASNTNNTGKEYLLSGSVEQRSAKINSIKPRRLDFGDKHSSIGT